LPTGTVVRNGTTVTLYTSPTSNPAAPPISTILSHVNERAVPWETFSTGVVSLGHDLYNLTASFGPPVIDAILKAGMNVKSVAQCINDEDPYVKENETITAVDIDLTTSVIPQPSPIRIGAQSDAIEKSTGITFWIVFVLQQIFGIN
jgi:hypothetical protein